MLRGLPGSGKTYFALTIIRRARQAGLAAGLIADDQTALHAAGKSGTDDKMQQTIRASCPDAIAGKIEVRPFGIVDTSDITSGPTVVALVCDLVDAQTDIDRVQQGNVTMLLGSEIAHLILPQRQAGPNCSAVFAALGLPCWY